MLRTTMLACAAIGVAGASLANPITYTFQSIATGDIGGQEFTEAPLTITLNGDTANVRNDTYGPTTYFHPAAGGVATFSIEGGPSGTFSDKTTVFDNQTAFGGGVGFTAVNPAGFNDIIQMHDDDLGSTFFSTYDLKSNTSVFGPAVNPSVSDFVGVHTSAGILDVSWMAENTFQATPEPASMAALGFGAIALIRRRRSRAS